MIPDILLNQRPGGTRWITAKPPEYAHLFGYPPPIMPQGEMRPGTGDVVQALMPSELDTLAKRYLENLKISILDPDRAGLRSPDAVAAEKSYAHYLATLLKHVVRSDRRIGLINLFWLAHAKTLREFLLSFFVLDPRAATMKYRLWPPLSGFLQRIHRNVFATLSPAEKRSTGFNLGRNFNAGLVESILEDQFALTEKDVRAFSPTYSLGTFNPHFLMDGEAWEAVMEEVEKRYRHSLDKGEVAMTQVLRRRTTGYSSPTDFFGADRLSAPSLYHSHVLHYYLNDEELAGRIMAENKNVRFMVEKLGGWGPFADELENVVQALQRSEYVQFLQEYIALIPPGLSDNDFKEMFLEGRLYKYAVNLPVVNNFRRVVILFADIREFTRTSELAISERELTERLYDVFDPVVHIVDSLGGTVDKFTGDGMMITFGALRSMDEPHLRALRCAIAIHEAVERLRTLGRTNFQMGLSIHTGRVFVANFMHDDEHKETTVIGRQVNLAARLSSTQSLDPDDGKGKAQPGGALRFERQRDGLRKTKPSDQGAVLIDGEGNFYNVGLAASHLFLEDLKKEVAMEAFDEEGRRGYRFQDRYLKSEVGFHYVGDARFKGFRETVPVYQVCWHRVTPNEGGS